MSHKSIVLVVSLSLLVTMSQPMQVAWSKLAKKADLSMNEKNEWELMGDHVSVLRAEEWSRKGLALFTTEYETMAAAALEAKSSKKEPPPQQKHRDPEPVVAPKKRE